MPLPNARINRLKRIARRLQFDDIEDDRDDNNKRNCCGIQTSDNHHESSINILSQENRAINCQAVEQVTYYNYLASLCSCRYLLHA